MKTSSPRKIKCLGRQVEGFKDSTWKQKREEIVFQNNMAKFTQNEHLLRALLNTGDRLMVEASPSDSIWGIGLNEKEAKQRPASTWPGDNLLEKVLTKVREEILKDNKLWDEVESPLTDKMNLPWLPRVLLVTYGKRFGSIDKKITESFNCTIIPNPEANHKGTTGLSKRFRDEVMKLDAAAQLADSAVERIVKDHSQEAIRLEGNDEAINVYAFACEHGKHRSVSVAETVAQRLRKMPGVFESIEVEHRDVSRSFKKEKRRQESKEAR